MKGFYLLTVLLVSSLISFSQTNSFPESGNVGVGTVNPDVAFKVVRTGANPTSEYSSINITTSGSGNIYGPILYLNGTSGVGGKNWGLVSSCSLDAPATGAAGNFAIYDTSAGSRLVINSSGHVGIGTNSPYGKLDVNGAILLPGSSTNTILRPTVDATRITGEISGYSATGLAGDDGFLRLSAGGGTNSITKTFIDLTGYSTVPDMRENITLGTAGVERIRITGEGHVGIGTTNPKEALSVKGKIRAQEIKVEMANWPDYVFAKSYQLPTLKDIEIHIKEKGYLPGIPSAMDVKENGVDLGEMNAKLLQKIEELTLYLIEQNKVIETYNKKMIIQDERILNLEAVNNKHNQK